MKKVKLFKPFVSWRAILETVRVLMSDQLAEGPRVKKFEKEFANKFELRNVVALNSGTSALELAYELAGIKDGDEVITPVLTCTATNIPLTHHGAKIIFADIDKDLNVSIEDVKRKITGKTKAIVFVHFGGNNRGLKELIEICQKHSIKLIEDAAQAVGSDFWGKADFACVSLQAIKTLTSGDGGFLICKNDEDFKKARRLRWFGYDREEKQKKGDMDLVEAGYKYHMNDITAAIGLGNIAVIEKLINHRKKLIEIYSKAGLNSHIWMTSVLGRDYASLSKKLKEHGYETGQHHYRNDKYTIFGGRQKLPIMDSIENNYFFVPMHHDVSIKQAEEIVSLLG